MYQLLYVSTAARTFAGPQLLDLVVRARENNAKIGITGMLLVKGGHFLQLLEGERNAVEALFQKIERDPRHRDVTTLQHGALEKRNFPNCALGLQDLASAQVLAVPGYGEFLNASLTPNEFRDASRAQKLVLLFQRRAR